MTNSDLTTKNSSKIIFPSFNISRQQIFCVWPFLHFSSAVFCLLQYKHTKSHSNFKRLKCIDFDLVNVFQLKRKYKVGPFDIVSLFIQNVIKAQ